MHGTWSSRLTAGSCQLEESGSTLWAAAVGAPASQMVHHYGEVVESGQFLWHDFLPSPHPGNWSTRRVGTRSLGSSSRPSSSHETAGGVPPPMGRCLPVKRSVRSR